MEELLHYLNEIHPLSENLVDFLSRTLKTKKLLKKDYLLKKGHVSRDICFINKGLLRCFYLVDNKEVCSWFMKEGDVIVSVESFFNQTESYESIQALEDCIVHYITHDELEFIYNTYPEFNFVGRVVLTKYYILSEQRLRNMRMLRAVERYSYILENHPELILRVPNKYIASYLGVAEPTLSNIKGSL